MIVCKDLNNEIIGQYATTLEAANDLLIDELLIQRALSSNNVVLYQQYIFSIIDNRGRHQHLTTSRPVVQLTKKTYSFVAEYNSIYEAQMKTGIKAIANVCKGKTKSAGGYVWMYKEMYDAV